MDATKTYHHLKAYIVGTGNSSTIYYTLVSGQYSSVYNNIRFNSLAINSSIQQHYKVKLR